MSSKAPRRQAQSRRAGLSCLYSFFFVAFAGSASADLNFFSGMQFGLANTTLKILQELSNNGSLGSGTNADSQPPVATVVFGSTFPMGPDGFAAGPGYSRQNFPIGSSVVVAETFSMNLQQDFGPSGQIHCSAGRVLVRGGGVTGGGFSSSIGAGTGLFGNDQLFAGASLETTFFDNEAKPVTIIKAEFKVRPKFKKGRKQRGAVGGGDGN